jgi:DNA-binding NarL/FixJ family response regulator
MADKKIEKVITVAIVEDSPHLRRSLEVIVSRQSTLCCVGVFPSAEDALATLPSLAPNVILMDINLPGMNGVECVRRLTQSNLKSLIMMLTVSDDDDVIFEALSSGAIGYLLKPVLSDELVKAIHEIHAGGAPMSMPIARRVVQTFKKPANNKSELTELTPRELEVLELLAKGFLSKEIAEQKGLNYWTVVDHVRHIYDKLHVRSRAQAVAKYLGT